MRTATELLRRAREARDKCDPNDVNDCMEKIRTFLSTPSDDAEEPVAWRLPYIPQPGTFFVTLDPVLAEAFEADEKIKAEPLYLHPPKPAEPEAEPVGYAVKMIPRGLHFVGFVGKEETDEEIEEYGPDQIVPLYTRPSPTRKPMTDEEMEKQYEIDKEYFGESVMRAFYNGVRFAEKHHGISGEDQ